MSDPEHDEFDEAAAEVRRSWEEDHGIHDWLHGLLPGGSPKKRPSLSAHLDKARSALSRLVDLPLRNRGTDVERDAAVQRFHATFEILWRTTQIYLIEVEGLEMGSPKGVIRAARQVGILDDADLERALAMTDDRNVSGHTYDEANAEAIFSHLPKHAETARRWLEALESRAAGA